MRRGSPARGRRSPGCRSRRSSTDRRPPVVSPPARASRCRSRTVVGRALRSALFTTSTSAISSRPGLARLHLVAPPGFTTTTVVSAAPRDLDLDLPDADRLDDDPRRARRRRARARPAASPARARRGDRACHRADEHAGVGGVVTACGTRSPRIAPPLNGLVGSTASTPTLVSSARDARSTSWSVSVDFPSAGAPVIPTDHARPVLQVQAAHDPVRVVAAGSTSEISLAIAARSPRARSTRIDVRRAGCPQATAAISATTSVTPGTRSMMIRSTPALRSSSTPGTCRTHPRAVTWTTPSASMPLEDDVAAVALERGADARRSPRGLPASGRRCRSQWCMRVLPLVWVGRARHCPDTLVSPTDRVPTPLGRRRRAPAAWPARSG